MPVQGITNGCQPVLGYNYGAGEDERVRRGIRFTTVLTVGYSVAAWAHMASAGPAGSARGPKASGARYSFALGNSWLK